MEKNAAAKFIEKLEISELDFVTAIGNQLNERETN